MEAVENNYWLKVKNRSKGLRQISYLIVDKGISGN